MIYLALVAPPLLSYDSSHIILGKTITIYLVVKYPNIYKPSKSDKTVENTFPSHTTNRVGTDFCERHPNPAK